jgi:hypothetical protein
VPSYFLRIGALAELHVGESLFTVDCGRRVIVRTARGVELAAVIGPYRQAIDRAEHARATILRPTTDEDELLIHRLDRHKREAVESCRERLSQLGSTSTLLDVDQLFDGGTLILHFLGPIDQIAQAVSNEVARQYESVVRTRHFAKLLSDGCGPDCGKAAAGGCTTGCAGCAANCGA